MSTHDVIVVGGGTSGAIVATRLAEAGVDTCLVEEGQDDAGQERVADVSRWVELLHADCDRDYPIEPQSRGNGDIRHSRARLLGGCSAHNSVIAFAPFASDLEAWVAAGADGWGPAEMRRALARVAERVHLEEASERNPCTAAWLQAATAIGIPAATFPAGAPEPGAGWVHVNAEGRRRSSSSEAYLRAAPGPKPVVRLASRVERVCFGPGSRATGVELAGGEQLRAAREVVLCAGAFDTPAVLLRSGIGAADQLRRHRIACVADVAGVGERLLDHPEGAVTWAPSRELGDEAVQHLEATILTGADGDPAGHELMCWLFTIPFAEATVLAGPASGQRTVTMAVDVAYARSEGNVRLRDGDPSGAPVIDPRYFTDPDGHDEAVLLAGLRLARRLADTEPFASWVGAEMEPGAVEGDALGEVMRRHAYTAYHPMASCRMGAASDRDAVVDPRLRVREVDALRIADASVFPTGIGVNPCLTCMAVGERAAELVLEDL